MKLLAVDIGNTQIVCGVFEEANLLTSFHLSTDHERTVDEHGLLIADLLELRTGRKIRNTDSIISSVVPPLTERMCTALSRYFGREPVVVGPDYARWGINVVYNRPEDVGADRVVDALAAREAFGAPVIVVDFGTATTVDLVNAEGHYAGGAIMPGLYLAAKSLFESAARLMPVELQAPAAAVGTNTDDSVKSGLVFGSVYAVDGMIERFWEELGARCPVVATGGQAKYLAARSRYIGSVDPNLTIKGLRLAYKNAAGR